MYKDDTVTIDRAEYNELLEAKCMLEALQGAGVDSWDGYDYAVEIFEATIHY